jgi:hypothetical protein
MQDALLPEGFVNGGASSNTLIWSKFLHKMFPQVGFSILSGILMAITLFMPIHTDYLKRFFSYSGAFLWTNFPESLRLW